MVRPGDDVVVEKPTYDRVLLRLRGLGAKVHQVTLDKDGLDVDELRHLLDGGLRPRLAYVIPTFQNPSGMTLSEPRRATLLELAAEFGFTVVEDDPYARIRFRGAPLPDLLSRDTACVVVHVGSFTKTVCPGVRVGYLIGPEGLVEAIARRATNQYLSPSMVSQGIVHQFCLNGDLDRSVEVTRTALRQRATTLASSLRKLIPGARFTEPDGGYFMWVELPDGIDAGSLWQEGQRHGVAFVRGTDFLLDGGENAVRLAFSSILDEDIDDAVRRLADAITEVRTPGAITRTPEAGRTFQHRPASINPPVEPPVKPPVELRVEPPAADTSTDTGEAPARVTPPPEPPARRRRLPRWASRGWAAFLDALDLTPPAPPTGVEATVDESLARVEAHLDQMLHRLGPPAATAHDRARSTSCASAGLSHGLPTPPVPPRITAGVTSPPGTGSPSGRRRRPAPPGS
ncbi:PLP-dependent aminotransferase family protein [Dactylosporangium sp. NPDC006015]|uniref:aminotransferase-like domain-containing protein n=1 Tax=Dactylosporangium sp. NPDC006015 TaxID=3154576 RepID=UPI0033B7A6A8